MADTQSSEKVEIRLYFMRTQKLLRYVMQIFTEISFTLTLSTIFQLVFISCPIPIFGVETCT